MAASIALHAVVAPSHQAVETADPSMSAAINSIRVALEKAEAANPGVVHELIDAILESEQAKGTSSSPPPTSPLWSSPVAIFTGTSTTASRQPKAVGCEGTKKVGVAYPTTRKCTFVAHPL